MFVQRAFDNTVKDLGLDPAPTADLAAQNAVHQYDHFQQTSEMLNMPYLAMAKKHVNLDQKKKNTWRRMKKQPDQTIILEEAFEQNPNWSMAEKIQIGAKVGMTPSQVGKWNWDHKKKLSMTTDRKKK